jgi:hypothetical protein
MASECDRVGRWFQIMDERGHSDRAQIFLESLAGGKGLDFSFPHREMDGAARLAQILTDYGIAYTKPKEMKRPSIFRRGFLLVRGLINNSNIPKPNWRKFEATQTEKSLTLYWLLLNPDANQKLCEHAKCEGVSVNSILMEVLSAEVARKLTLDPGKFRGAWMVPVSMRGAFAENLPKGNKVSYFAVRAQAGATAKDFSSQIREGFQRQVHWSNWMVYKGLTYLGLRLMRKLSAWSAKKVFWIGTFSDLGDWTPAYEQTVSNDLKASVWVAAPIGSPNNPVSCASASWYGHRTVSLRLHPSICGQSSADTASEILKSVADSLCGKLRIPQGHVEIRRSNSRAEAQLARVCD